MTSSKVSAPPSTHIVGIAGGSGSGKTTFAQRLIEKLGADRAAILSQDSYYIDQSHRFDGDGGSVNFDHPDALDFSLLEQHLVSLKDGAAVEVPRYDFVTHTRLETAIAFAPVRFVLLDGTLVLSQSNLRPHFAEAIFLEASEEVRFSRRLRRDTQERGREAEGVRRQFELQVKPMHDLFVEPSKRHANQLIPNDEPNDSHVETVLHTLVHRYGT